MRTNKEIAVAIRDRANETASAVLSSSTALIPLPPVAIPVVDVNTDVVANLAAEVGTTVKEAVRAAVGYASGGLDIEAEIAHQSPNGSATRISIRIGTKGRRD